MSKLYEINIEESKKTLYVKTSGFFKEEDALAYMNDFQAALKKINVPSYTLLIDATEQKAVGQDTVDELKAAIKMYMDCGFKKIAILNPASAVAKMQVQKCIKELNFNASFVDSIEAAYNL